MTNTELAPVNERHRVPQTTFGLILWDLLASPTLVFWARE
jgi:hypothetical protein